MLGSDSRPSRVNQAMAWHKPDLGSSNDVLLSTVSSHKAGLVTRDILNHFNPSAKEKARTKLGEFHLKAHSQKDEEVEQFFKEFNREKKNSILGKYRRKTSKLVVE